MSTSPEIILYEKNILNTKDKFYLFMDLLVSNQSSTRTECVFFFLIFYLQYISEFFRPNINIFKTTNSSFDNICYFFQKISRFKNLIDENNNNENLHLIFICIFLLFDFILVILCVISILKMTKKTLYTLSKKIINYLIKILIFILYNIVLDFCFSYFSYHDKQSYHIVLCLLTFIITTLLKVFIQYFYSDTYYLSSSFYAKVSTNYDIYSTIHSIFFSFISQQCHNLTREFFFLYNIIIGLFFFVYYTTHYIYYDRVTNIICGIFHLWFIYISLFCFVFYFININEKGIVFIISSLFIISFYFNLRTYIEKQIFFKKPFYKISNQYYVLFYLKTMIEKIDTIEQVQEDKSLLIGIIQMHIIECPNDTCIMKHNQKIYLPISQKWSYRDQPMIYDKVFLINFIVAIMNFYIAQSYYNVDMLINLSFYYLSIIGNNCLCLFYYKKVSEMKLNLQEQFSFKRLSFAIEKMFVEKLRGQNEPCFNLEDLNVSYYFKYEQLSNKFYNEISTDVNFLIKFWKSFIKEPNHFNIANSNTSNLYLNDNNNSGDHINYSKIFDLTNKIRISKKNVETIWEELFDLYNGINENFELYLNYIENINDDGKQKRELENFKRKMENSAENYQLNFYNILFGKNTGIVIVNGDKGKEGIIEKVNKQMEHIFLYPLDELKGMNISQLMPKIFETHHTMFMQNYFNIGEKKIIDNKDFKTYAKDKSNSIILIKKNVKLFPMLNNSVYFVAMIIKEKINDIIFIDDNLAIQGISGALKKRLLLNENNNVFINNEIPFYVICKRFVNFYKMFILKEKAHNDNKNNLTTNLSQNNSLEGSDEENGSSINNEGPNPLNTFLIKHNSDNYHTTTFNTTLINNQSKLLKLKKQNRQFKEAIEINENIELEYEIKVPKFLCDYINSEMNRNIGLFQNYSSQNKIEEAENNFLTNFAGTDDYVIGNNNNNTNLVNKNVKNNVTPTTPGDENNPPKKQKHLTPEVHFDPKIVGPNPSTANSQQCSSQQSRSDLELINQSSHSEINPQIPNSQSNMNNNIYNSTTFGGKNNANNNNGNSSQNLSSNQLAYLPNSQTNKSNLNTHKLNYNEPPTNSNFLESGLNLAKKINQLHYQIECEEKEFYKRLNRYKELFNEKNYKELEEYIDLNNKDASVEFKFNFTFDIYKFGDEHLSYVIRCIDNNQKENDLSDDLSENNNNTNCINLKKEILDSLKYENELLYEEIAELKNLPERFLNLMLENKSFEKMISEKKDEINKNSRIHGNKRKCDQIQDDENSSQASSSSYNEDLCKRNRIEEIRGNTLKSISNFYTLNYIRILVIIVVLCELAFFVIYLINIDYVYKDMKIISAVNISFYENCIWIANLISSLISMRTLIEFNNMNQTYAFRSFIEDNNEYFNKLKSLSNKWYDYILSTEGYIDKNINKYIKNGEELYWQYVSVTYGLLENEMNNDGEAYPLSVLQFLSNVNTLITNDKYVYNMKYDELTEEEKDTYLYIHYMVIENAIINILPNQLNKLSQIPEGFFNYTTGSRNKLILIIVIYVICIAFFIVMYTILLYKTSKSMGEGFGKVAKIKQDKIEELIKKLEAFNAGLQQYLEKDVSSISSTFIKTFENFNNNNSLEQNQNNFFEDDAKDSLLPYNNVNNNKNTTTPGHTPISTPSFDCPTTKNNKRFEAFGNHNSFTNYTTNNGNNINNILINNSGNNTNTKIFTSSKMQKRFGKISSNDNAILGQNNLINFNGEIYNISSLQRKESKVQSFSIVSTTLIQTFFIICFFVCFLLIITFITNSMITKTGRILEIETFFLGKNLITVIETINIKCEMSLCQIRNTTIDFSSLVSKDLNRKIANWISHIEYLGDFYEKFYTQNACLAAFNLNKNIELKEVTFDYKIIYSDVNFQTCMNDIVVKSANNTEGLIQLIDNKIKIIRNEIAINKQHNEQFLPYEMYDNENFYIIEKVFYNYLIAISDNFSLVIQRGFEINVEKLIHLLTTIMIVFGICIFITAVYIGVIYVKTLVHLLSVSRCILKIIPTVIISSTPELESWIEASY